MIADAENHSAIAATWHVAMMATDATFDGPSTGIAPVPEGRPRRQIFGSVTPCCPWYLPPRSLYDVSQTSSDSKKITCATPSLA